VAGFDRIIVATDSPEIERLVRGFDAEVMLTRQDHATGTDRAEEVATRLGVAEDDIVVNFQADEPFVDARTVEAAVRALDRAESAPDVSTLAAPIQSEDEWRSPGVVKVARAPGGRALYFSRSPIPHPRDREPDFSEDVGSDGAAFLRHIGVYACRRSVLRRWSDLPESELESIERLEQLRALEAGMRIHVEVGPPTGPGIDVPADIGRAERILVTASH